jgi:hypothetical protein
MSAFAKSKVARVNAEILGQTQLIAMTLKPAFDSTWNACSFPRSCNYDENSRWAGQR